MKQHEQNASALVELLSNHSKVSHVYYPGLKHHPSHEIAKKQQSGFGGMLSFEVKNGLPEVKKFVDDLKNLRIKNITYYGSQSWPFPSQLMLWYHAEYDEGIISPDGVEIDKAGWFKFKDLPQVPTGNISISGKLIESYIEKLNG